VKKLWSIDKLGVQHLIFNRDPDVNLLVNHQVPLYRFLETAFLLTTHRDSSHLVKVNRLSDVAMLWLRVL
jgi:hypothetical protein